MKKIYFLILTVFLNAPLFSCTPDTTQGYGPTEEGTYCGDDVPIPPPPPPDPGG